MQTNEKSPGQYLKYNLQSLMRERGPSFEIVCPFPVQQITPKDTARKSHFFFA